MSKKLFFLWLILIIVFGVHLDSLSQRVLRMEAELKALRSIPTLLFSVESKTAALQNILSHEAFSKRRSVHVFRSAQNIDELEDALISNAPHQADYNWGAGLKIGAGYDGQGNIYRTLIRFNELKKAIPEGTQIMAATVYLKQHDNGSKDDHALMETFNLLEVEKKWGEGNKTGSHAEPGEVTWNAAAWDILNWRIPGCSARGADADTDTILATTGANINDAGDGWVAFSFTPAGIARLDQRIHNNNESDYGFLIKLADEELKKKNTFVSFHSSNDERPSNRPYIEIIYIDLGNPA